MATPNETKGTILDDPDAVIDTTFDKTEDFFRKYKKIISGVLGVALLAVAGYFSYKYYNQQQNEEAQNEMYQAVYYFEADSLDKALKGSGKDLGLLDISEEYGSTAAGNLTNFYVGVAYLKKGKFEDAIEYLKKFSSDDLLLQARAYCLLGDAYLEQKDVEEAISYYNKAADYYPNEYFTPRYLMKAALAYELNKDYKAAAEAYDEIIEKYYKSLEANDAKKYKARAEELAAAK